MWIFNFNKLLIDNSYTKFMSVSVDEINLGHVFENSSHIICLLIINLQSVASLPWFTYDLSVFSVKISLVYANTFLHAISL